MAQQMETDDKGTETSFRQWNPQKLTVPWGQDNSSTDAEDQEQERSTCYYCSIFALVERFFKINFPEVINVMVPKIKFK